MDDPAFVGFSTVTVVTDVFKNVMNPGFYWNIPPWLSFFHAFFLFYFRILALRISRRSMLGECQGANLPFGIQRMCGSRRNLCSCPSMVRASAFWMNIVLKKARFLSFFVFFLCDLFAAEASVKRERPFGTPVLRTSSKIRVKRKTLIHRWLLWWTRWVSRLKPTDPCRFVWSSASFVAYP